MTTGEKADLVKDAHETHGLNSVLSVLDLPKSTWYYHKNQKIPYEDKYAHVHPLLEDIARKHPGYGWTGRLLLSDGIKLSYALGGAKDNPEMESFFSRFKAEGHSLFLDAQDIDELSVVVVYNILWKRLLRYSRIESRRRKHHD